MEFHENTSNLLAVIDLINFFRQKYIICWDGENGLTGQAAVLLVDQEASRGNRVFIQRIALSLLFTSCVKSETQFKLHFFYFRYRMCLAGSENICSGRRKEGRVCNSFSCSGQMKRLILPFSLDFSHFTSIFVFCNLLKRLCSQKCRISMH